MVYAKDQKICNFSGESKLQQEIKKKNTSLERVRGLLQENPHTSFVNWKDRCGYTALLDACADGNAELVETLIKHGADVNIFNEIETITALMDVCHAGWTHLIDILLK